MGEERGDCLMVNLSGTRILVFLLLLTGILIFSKNTEAAISDAVIADVTPRAFSVVWVSDEAVSNATVKVFSDASATNDITSTLSVSVVSGVTALNLGIVKIDIQGVAPDTIYYVQTQTTGASGLVVFPDLASLLQVRTAVAVSASASDGSPITNDLLVHDMFTPDGVSAAEGALLVLSIPSISQYPLTAFVADASVASGAVIDLNNLIADATGTNAQLAGGTVIEISEYRGLLCSGLGPQKQLRLRRAPVHLEVPVITEAEVPAECFSPNGHTADFNCDAKVSAGDFNLFLSNFGLTSTNSAPDWRFNADFDLNNDRVIGAGDFNLFLSVFGQAE